MATYTADDAAIFYPCRFDDVTTALHRRTQAKNDEIWFRIFGDNLQFNFRAPSSSPISISVDGGAWATAGGFTTFSNSVTNLSTNVLPGGTSDDWHDIRIRTRDGGNTIALRLTDGIVVTSTGGVAALARHTDAGEYENIRGTRAGTYWRDTFSDVNMDASFTSPIFPQSWAITGGASRSRSNYCQFYVDADTTNIYVLAKLGGGGQDGVFSVFVEGKRHSIQTTVNTDGAYGLWGPIPIPGTGTRLVKVLNARAICGIVTNGAFVDTVVPTPTFKVCWVGDSVTAGDSVLNAGDTGGNWDNLCEIVDGRFISYNRGLSGQGVNGFNANSRAVDIPADADLVICNMSLNDASSFASSLVATTAAYVTMYNAILTQCPDATLLCVPQLPYSSTNRTEVVTGITQAVIDVDDPRCIYESSDGWVATLRSGSHPRDMSKAEACGGGIAAVRVADQPSDGDTITVNGIVFEFDSNASVTGGRTAVTIGATLVDTIENLAVAIETAGGSFDLLQRIILVSDTGNQGVAVRDCSSLAVSGSNLTAYGPHATGWMTLLNEYLPAAASAAYKNMMLLGVG